MGLVVRSVLRWLKASWQSVLQWKTASFRIKACSGPAIAAKFLTYRRKYPARPKKEQTSVAFWGGLLSLMAASRAGSGRRPR